MVNCFPRSRLNPRTAFESKVKNIGSSVMHPSWSQADVEMLRNDVSRYVCDVNFSQASKCGVRAKSIAMRIQFRGDSAPNPPSHLGRFEWKPYLNIKIYQDQALENQCLDLLVMTIQVPHTTNLPFPQKMNLLTHCDSLWSHAQRWVSH